MKKTIENLAKAFFSEDHAKKSYKYYAEIAEKEGFSEIARVFENIAANETEHAKYLSLLLSSMSKGKKGRISFVMKRKAKNHMQDPESSVNGQKSFFVKGDNFFEKTNSNHNHGFIEISQFPVCNDTRGFTLKNDNISKGKKYRLCRMCGCIIEGKDRADSCPLCNSSRRFWFVRRETQC